VGGTAAALIPAANELICTRGRLTPKRALTQAQRAAPPIFGSAAIEAAKALRSSGVARRTS
jgi:hypothetical protein